LRTAGSPVRIKPGSSLPHLSGNLAEEIETEVERMDGVETPETGSNARGGRPPKTVAITVNLPVADHETLAKAGIKKMRQTGEDVTRDRLISEAIQQYAKSLSSAE
jgi:hypothetical protein